MTKVRNLALVGVASFSLLCGAAVLARADRHEAPTASTDEVLEGSIDSHMQALNGSMRKLKKSIGDAKTNDESLALLTKMQLAALNCKDIKPRPGKDVPEDKKAAYVFGFRKHMGKLLQALVDTEMLVIEGKNADALKSLDNLESLKSAGHNDYKKN
jgi:soluble cytochrome b562